MGNETQKVDACLELRNAAQFLRDDGWTERAAAVEAVSAAVSKLIEATRELIEHDEPVLRDLGFIYVGKIEKAKKALARIGGAA